MPSATSAGTVDEPVLAGPGTGPDTGRGGAVHERGVADMVLIGPHSGLHHARGGA